MYSLLPNVATGWFIWNFFTIIASQQTSVFRKHFCEKIPNEPTGCYIRQQRVLKRLKGQKGPRSLKISPLWSRNVWPLPFLNKRIDRLCCAVHNLSIRLFRKCDATQSWHKSATVISEILQGYEQFTICQSKNSKFQYLLRACKIKFFMTWKLAFRMTFLHWFFNQMV